MNKKHQFWFLMATGFSILSVLLASFKYSQAQSADVSVDAADAIAVRVIPNPNHYSIVRWYESQGFSGAPQALVVDGYEAIRDGRTVYVNAANVDTASRGIYTNIYLISYNQDSAAKTVDILGQIVSHWKFNNNITDGATLVPDCSISGTACNSDTECPADQYCATAVAGIASSSCLLKTPKNCLVDTDCPSALFCNSIKSKITRDVKRLGQLEEMKEALFNFKQRSNYYPRLSSGTYLANNSLSVWPSWTQSLLSDIAVSQNLADPINRLGACPGYDVKTCWSAESKKFIFNSGGDVLTLPAGSYAFAYSTDSDGADYNLCATLETRATDVNYHFLPDETDPTSSACVSGRGIVVGAFTNNTVPSLVDQFLIGQANMEFSGFLKVVDAENNPLTWSIAGPSWVSLQSTSDPTQKKVYASSAAAPGIYNLKLTVSDSQGGVLSTTTKIVILPDAPRIEAADAEYILDPKIPFDYNFTFSSKNLATPSAAYAVSKTSGSYDILNGFNLSRTFTALSGNNFKVDYAGLIATTHKFYQDANIKYRINITDKNGLVYPKDLNLKIISEQPQLNVDCATQARIDTDYSCFIGPRTQGNHTLTYSVSGLPAGLALSSAGDAVISGRPTISASSGGTAAEATPSVAGYNIRVKTINEYGASSSQAFVLKLNNYCGDGKIEYPNNEGRGGIYNDGYEDCDGLQGVISTPAASKINAQYGCRTEVGSSVPNPIFTNTYCIFKSPLEGGGYCGDTYCQASVNGKTMETCSNCQADCGVCPCIPDCTNKTCGSDGCGDVCGLCDNDTQVCFSPFIDSSHEQSYCCTPNCTGKVCGDDGCGGLCGTCASNSLCNADSSACCPKQANIQVCADNSHITYFNGSLVGNGTDWHNVEQFQVTVKPGKNVMAIQAIDKGGIYGFSATLNQAPCQSMTTDDINGWKCVGVLYPGWNSIDFNDSSWPTAVIVGTAGVRPGNYLPYQQIWAYGFATYSTIYCRYTFFSQVSSAN